jgi:hypothetical protein
MRGMKLGLLHLILGGIAAYALISVIFIKRISAVDESAGYNLVLYSGFFIMLIAFLAAYTFMPLVSSAILAELRKNRTWAMLARFRELLTNLSFKKLQSKASSLIRRSVILFDRIESMNISSSISKRLKDNLGQLSEAGLKRLDNMNKTSEILMQYQKKGIDKQLTSLERALKSSASPQMKKKIIDRIGELTTEKTNFQKIEQQYDENDITVSHILAELNSLYVLLQEQNISHIKDEFSYAVKQWSNA